ncbi:MAG: 2-dehydropantoate 2-reductase [Oscillochloris sp.]|nr:2-dehydropantoate 2-reductase [Oscillochloris sp.]
MRIAVLGVGGVGGYFGGRLAAAGNDVYFIARGAHLQAIRAHGLRIESINGDATIQPAQASDNPAAIGPVDLVLLGVKSWQVAQAAESARSLLGPQTAVLPLLNGVEAALILSDVLGPQHTLGGLCKIIAYIAAPGLIRHTGIAPSVTFGELDNTRSARVEAILAAFTQAGVGAEIAPDIQRAIWEKFLLIVTWSGIGAITRAPIGVWRSLPGTRAMAEQSMREALAVAHAHGVNLPDSAVEATLKFIDGVQAGGTASMQRDIMEGRPSELEAQNGALVRLGAGAGVDTPLHRFIYNSLLPQEQAARS